MSISKKDSLEERRIRLRGHQGPLVLVGPLFALLTPEPSAEGLVVAVDGGAAFLREQQILSIGDGDSLGSLDLDVLLSPAKDHSDLFYALEELGASARDLRALGFWGGRQDHQFLALADFYQYAQRTQSRIEVARPALPPLLVLPPGPQRFTHHGPFSLLSFLPQQLSLAGACQYPVKDLRISGPSSRLLSNEARGEVSVEGQAALVLFRELAP